MRVTWITVILIIVAVLAWWHGFMNGVRVQKEKHKQGIE
jgi:hypothetical protein